MPTTLYEGAATVVAGIGPALLQRSGRPTSSTRCLRSQLHACIPPLRLVAPKRHSSLVNSRMLTPSHWPLSLVQALIAGKTRSQMSL
mmetsp:Transcript_17289/g.25605  ORF Transcript_17289/g.25605 Transcript_17289/m.25605 type:complete len:87 (+) Transcript_17289:585-845(+)